MAQQQFHCKFGQTECTVMANNAAEAMRKAREQTGKQAAFICKAI